MRLFFALWPDARARAALSRLAGEVARDGQGRSPRDSNLHITVAFLGEVPQARVDALLRIGGEVAMKASSFPITLARIGGGRYQIAWIAPPSVSVPLGALQATLVQALEAAGFPLEQRMFRPHVTLARDCARLARRGDVAPIGWEVRRLSLVASTLAAGGSEYRDLGDWPLGAHSTGIV